MKPKKPPVCKCGHEEEAAMKITDKQRLDWVLKQEHSLEMKNSLGWSKGWWLGTLIQPIKDRNDIDAAIFDERRRSK